MIIKAFTLTSLFYTLQILLSHFTQN